MAEEKKKATKKKAEKKKAPLPRGGRREGAGRKKGTMLVYQDEPLTGSVTMRIREVTQRRIKELREATKSDEMPFNRMFESWVEDMAKEYGIE